MRLEVEVKAGSINRKELIEKINDAIDEETTDICSVEMSYYEEEED